MLLRPIPTLLLVVIAGCAASGSPDHGNEPNLLEVVRGTGDPPTAARTGGASAESWPIPLAYFEDFEDAKVTLALEGAGAASCDFAAE